MALGHQDSHMKKNEFRFLLHTITKMNSKWITELNASAKTITFLGLNIGVSLCDLGLGNGSLGMTPKHKWPMKKIDNLNFITI